jgi:hypothetical protein
LERPEKQGAKGGKKGGTQRLDSLCRGQGKQFDAAALGFLLDFIHDGQRTGSGADNKRPALPGNVLAR